MEADPRELELEQRIRHMEREMASLSALLTRNTEIVDDIRNSLNRPVNWPSWIGASIGVASLLSGLLYTAFIQPVSLRVEFQQDMIESLEIRYAEIDRRLDASKELLIGLSKRSASDAGTVNSSDR